MTKTKIGEKTIFIYCDSTSSSSNLDFPSLIQIFRGKCFCFGPSCTSPGNLIVMAPIQIEKTHKIDQSVITLVPAATLGNRDSCEPYFKVQVFLLRRG